ncbi:hypothetical protein L195_g044422 [Trifolium pratense]|uniref:Uncharacterized protein n=1 Tax=Trifolium pratense TaxID=57577 RepID=A0A2K3MC17_TRIPR|nr:hypothetical protein L195_g044422 [Trifolium pratense]
MSCLVIVLKQAWFGSKKDGGEAQPHPPEVQEGQPQDEIPLSQSGPVQELSQEVPNIAETSGHRQKEKTYGLRGPVVYPSYPK